MVKANNLHDFAKHECVVKGYRLGCGSSVGLVQILLKSVAFILLKKKKIWLKPIIYMIVSSLNTWCSGPGLAVDYPVVSFKSC